MLTAARPQPQFSSGSALALKIPHACSATGSPVAGARARRTHTKLSPRASLVACCQDEPRIVSVCSVRSCAVRALQSTNARGLTSVHLRCTRPRSQRLPLQGVGECVLCASRQRRRAFVWAGSHGWGSLVCTSCVAHGLFPLPPAAASNWRLWRGQVVSAAAFCGAFWARGALKQCCEAQCGRSCRVFEGRPLLLWPAPPQPQDDTYTESYISTIGVDFVRDGACVRGGA